MTPEELLDALAAVTADRDQWKESAEHECEVAVENDRKFLAAQARADRLEKERDQARWDYHQTRELACNDLRRAEQAEAQLATLIAEKEHTP